MDFPELDGAEGLPDSANLCSVVDNRVDARGGTEERGIGWTNHVGTGRGTEEQEIGYERGLGTKS